MKFRPSRQPEWEILEYKDVAPTPVYYDNDHDLEICRVAPVAVSGTYVFEMKTDFRAREALEHAREQLMQEIAKDGYNFLVLEGWSLTRMRKLKAYRIEVRYNAHPAIARGSIRQRTPPFLALLDVR